MSKVPQYWLDTGRSVKHYGWFLAAQKALRTAPEKLDDLAPRQRAAVKLCFFGEGPKGDKYPTILSPGSLSFKQYAEIMGGLSGVAIRRHLISIGMKYFYASHGRARSEP